MPHTSREGIWTDVSHTRHDREPLPDNRSNRRGELKT